MAAIPQKSAHTQAAYRSDTLRDFSASPRLLLLAAMALVAGSAGAFAAFLLLKLIALFTNLAYLQRLSFDPIHLIGDHLPPGRRSEDWSSASAASSTRRRWASATKTSARCSPGRSIRPRPASYWRSKPQSGSWLCRRGHLAACSRRF